LPNFAQLMWVLGVLPNPVLNRTWVKVANPVMTDQNSVLHNLVSGSWLAKSSGAAALCSLSISRANGHWTHGCSQQAHHRSNQPHQACTLISIHQMAPLQAN